MHPRTFLFNLAAFALLGTNACQKELEDPVDPRATNTQKTYSQLELLKAGGTTSTYWNYKEWPPVDTLRFTLTDGSQKTYVCENTPTISAVMIDRQGDVSWAAPGPYYPMLDPRYNPIVGGDANHTVFANDSTAFAVQGFDANGQFTTVSKPAGFNKTFRVVDTHDRDTLTLVPDAQARFVANIDGITPENNANRWFWVNDAVNNTDRRHVNAPVAYHQIQ